MSEVTETPKRRIIKFAWIPKKTREGWIWLMPYFKDQVFLLKWQFVPEIKPYQSWQWVTVGKTIGTDENFN